MHYLCIAIYIYAFLFCRRLRHAPNVVSGTDRRFGPAPSPHPSFYSMRQEDPTVNRGPTYCIYGDCMGCVISLNLLGRHARSIVFLHMSLSAPNCFTTRNNLLHV